MFWLPVFVQMVLRFPCFQPVIRTHDRQGKQKNRCQKPEHPDGKLNGHMGGQQTYKWNNRKENGVVTHFLFKFLPDVCDGGIFYPFFFMFTANRRPFSYLFCVENKNSMIKTIGYMVAKKIIFIIITITPYRCVCISRKILSASCRLLSLRK